MARIEKTIDVDCSASELWQVVGDIGGIATWFPGLVSSSYAHGIRRCTMEGGGDLVEEISARDDGSRRYEYRMVEAPMTFTHHFASMSVSDLGAGRSRMTWTTDILPDAIAGPMEQVIDGGLLALRDRLDDPKRRPSGNEAHDRQPDPPAP